MTDYPFQPIAVVGVGAVMPDAPNADAFWHNIRTGRYSISETPPQRWDPALYYDPDPSAPDKTYSTIGGWVREFDWNPMAWRLPIPPKVSDQLDIGQQWSVAGSRMALMDAGWPDWSVDSERVAVIIGNAIGGEKHYESNLRIELPEFIKALAATETVRAMPAAAQQALLQQAREAFLAGRSPINEDTMPGELANIIAGRVAALFNFRGPNFTTDAACASGLAGMSAAVQGLQSHAYDAVVTGGVDRNMGISAFVKFCKIGALSATGTRPFDAGADGFVMGEGAALFVLRRLADAERDGQHVYGVIRGLAGSSDGRGKGITAPNPVGQKLAVERAWATAGLDPTSAGYIEAHGTSTRVGDAAELTTLNEVFLKAGAAPGTIALGSVKSNIGHLKAAAGTAGFFKAIRCLDEKVLVPSLNFNDPNPRVDWDATPFRVNTELREWPASREGARRAGVSAFGFGGTNFHVVVEEYVPGRLREESAPRSFASADVPQAAPAPAPVAATKPPLRGALVLGGSDDAEVVAQLRTVAADAAAGTAPPVAPPDPALADAAVRLAIDYADADDLAKKADKALKAFAANNAAMWKMLRAQGVFVGRGPAPKVAFLYTGQGSQYVNMLHELRRHEPIVADTFVEADTVMTPILGRPLSSYIFIDTDDPAAVKQLEQQLLQTEITQPAVLATDLSMTRMLNAYGVWPDMCMGHSLGEYGALVAAGSLSFAAALEAVAARGHEMASLDVGDNGAMAAVFGPLDEISRIVEATDGYVVVANINSYSQAVVGGSTEAVERAMAAFGAAGITAARIPVSHAFHTSIVAPSSEPLRRVLRRLDVRPPVRPIVANVTGEFYPQGATVDTMVDILGQQVASPVQFVKGLQTLYDAGARVFVEVGPKKALHGFVEDVLGSRHDDVLALFTNHPKQGDLVSFNQALCGLYASGLALTGPSAVPNQSSAPSTARPQETTTSASPPPAPAQPPFGAIADKVTEIGQIFADAVERGLAALAGPQAAPTPAAGGSPATGEPVVITGASVGLPGTERVFDDANVARILSGEQFIDAIPMRIRREMVDRHITRLVKRELGEATFETIADESEVIKLAGRAAPLDVVTEFGVDAARDAALDDTTRLSIGAGIDALRDAGIPLVMRYRTTTLGTQLPDRWGLPDALRDETGVIFASAFPGYDQFAEDLQRYYTDRARREQLLALEAVRARLTGAEPAASEVDRRITELRRLLQDEPFMFDRRFIFRALSMGHSQFAELIGARGPNTQVNAACASTTQAIAIAEDWIATGRCRRVVIVSADDVSSDVLLPWVGSGFLATGAAATDANVEDAATPFDRRRHGMIVGMGAAALVVEAPEAARERGIQPICDVLATVTLNSAFHGTRLDVSHVASTMEQLVAKAERRGIRRADIAAETMFMSHETYTPARGGSAAAEITALRHVFGELADTIVITNTKGFTGHAMGAGVEDVVAVKALETGIVPPVPNYREPDPDLGQLNLSRGGSYPVGYALRLAAGFGSQIAMALLRWTPMPSGQRTPVDRLGYASRIVDANAWQQWLDLISGKSGSRVEVVDRRLRVVDAAASAAAPPVPAPPVAAPAPVPTPTPVAPPPPPPMPAAPPAPAPEPVAASDPVVDKVVAIVSEMTGYPPELLDPDLDLEADLGVDTVKQAEVFAAVREEFGVERDPNLQLRDFPTLTHVIGWVRDKTGGAAAPASAPSPASPAVSAGVHAAPAAKGDLAATDTLPRRVPVPSLRPSLEQCVPTGITLDGDSRIVVMKDSSGIGKALLKRLDKLGATVLELEPGVATDELATAVEGFAAEGAVQGVYWLAAMDDEGSLDSMDLAGWREALRRRVKTLYATMRALYEHNPFLVSATRMGGYHGYNESGATSPMGGAVTGFTKAYQRERFEDRPLVKAVDFAPSRKTAALADVLIDETLRDPGCVEVGHADDARWTIGLVERPFPAEPSEDALGLAPDTVALVTGAAGSIVSAIVADLAEGAGGGTFHLLDLTPEPDPNDENLQAYITDVNAFKLQVAAELKAKGERATPVAIERELAKYERSQAALAAIQAVRDAGGTVRYHAIDLTDPAQVAAVVDEIRQQSGRIDLLLHAAGALQDRPLPSKEPRMFDLVVDVKSDGWFNLLTAAADLPIGATVAFSSVAGRFGNSAQTDYAAANDLLCKTTSAFRTTRPGTRGYALDWTAWGGIGMATRGSVAKIMEMAGVEMLPPEAGVAWIRREITAGTPAGEVVVAGKLGMMAAEPHETGGLDIASLSIEGTGPLVGEVVSAGVLDGITVRTTLDPTEQPFLNDHRINGTPVFPGVMYMEAFAEASALLLPGWHVVAVEHVDYLGALKFFRDEPRQITVTALVRPDAENPDDLIAECTLSAERTLPGQDAPQRTVHGNGRVRLSATPRSAPTGPKPGRKAKSSLSDEQIYSVYFHGEAYQVLDSVWRAKDGAAVGRFADDLPPNHVPSESPLLIGPRLAELCFQTAGMEEMGREGKNALPLHVGSWQVFGTPTEDGPLTCTARPTDNGFDCLVQTNDGTVVAHMSEYWTVVTPDPLPEDEAALLAGVMAH
jgi:acyl transferase domain-containing protein/acyl carrier protein